MLIFTIDFMGLINAQAIPYDDLAAASGLSRERVVFLANNHAMRYDRLKCGKMLRALNVRPFDPMRIEASDDGPRLSVNWDPLIEATGYNLADLVRMTRLRRHHVEFLIRRNPTQYAREVLGTTLDAFGVTLYPPFYLQETDESGEPTHDLIQRYFRTNKHEGIPG